MTHDPNCPRCRGTGIYETTGDLHRSAGIVPCYCEVRPSRDEVGLGGAFVWSSRATCGRRRVGCVLVDAAGYQLGSGYNGTPSGWPHCDAANPCPGFALPSGTALDACDAVHAEINALSRCERPRDLHTCYVTTSPCAECVKALLNTPCRRIVFAEEYAGAHVELARGRWERAGREWTRLSTDLTERLAQLVRTCS